MHSTVGIAAAAILAIANALPQASSTCVQQPAGLSTLPVLFPFLPATAAIFGPENYELKFAEQKGAISGGNYLTYEQLDSYDVDTCAAFCTSLATCVAFNIYFERDPALNGDGCTLTGTDVDDTITIVHCSLWGALPPGKSYDDSYLTNTGQWAVDGTFQVAITGSNVYEKKN